MTFAISSLLLWLVLFLVQLLAAIPWVFTLFTTPALRADLYLSFFQLGNAFKTIGGEAPSAGPSEIPVGEGKRGLIVTFLLIPILLIFLPCLALFFTQRDWLETMGGYYAAILQFQLTLDAFLLIFFLLLKFWPKGGAVALAAFREGVRQPMFWLLVAFSFLFLSAATFIPYFTFGEDYIMVKDLGFDTLLLSAVLFGTLAASMSIAEEIEGRTAVTVMSKPISRRQFLLGKYVGITLCSLLMFSLLACYFGGVLDYKFWWDRNDPVPPALWVVDSIEGFGFKGENALLLLGVGKWIHHTLDLVPGFVLFFCQVMVLVAVAVSLATRVSMVVNMSAILILYMAANLAPVLVSIGAKMQADAGAEPGAVVQIVSFTAQVFNTILPALQVLRPSQAVVGDTSLVSWTTYSYMASAMLYTLLYTSIVLLLGLIFFEDRDLA